MREVEMKLDAFLRDTKPEWGKIIKEYEDEYKEFNEEYHAFIDHTVLNKVKVILKEARIEVNKQVPSARSKKGFVIKKVEVDGYWIGIIVSAGNLKEGFNPDEFANIITNDSVTESLEEAEKIFEEYKGYVEGWKIEATQPRFIKPEGFVCEECRSQEEIKKINEDKTYPITCVREQMTGRSYLENNKGESEYMCLNCPSIYRDKCHYNNRK